MKKASFLLLPLFFIFLVYSQDISNSKNSLQNKKKIQESEEPTITLTLKDTDIRTFLQAVAEAAKVNIIPGPEVEAKITARLKNIPWKKALNVVLKAYGFEFEEIAPGIIYVTTLEKMAEKRKLEREVTAQEPLITETFSLNYAKVDEISKPIKQLLTPRGKITYDTRTNTLIITDTKSNLESLRNLIKSLDRKTKQILIEVRIEEADVNLTEKLGINWALSNASINFPKAEHQWPFGGGTKFEKRYIKGEWPAPTLTHGVIDLSSVSAILDALETEGSTKLIAHPKVVTLENEPAKIKVVTEWPIPNYFYNSETGQWEITGFEYKDIGVVLEVTPQINEENMVTLKVRPEITEESGEKLDFTGGAQLPITLKREAELKVSIKNGQTLVIGGLIKSSKNITKSKLPLLSKIPILGWFFTHNYESKKDIDLLIFITPHILEEFPKSK